MVVDFDREVDRVVQSLRSDETRRAVMAFMVNEATSADVICETLKEAANLIAYHARALERVGAIQRFGSLSSDARKQKYRATELGVIGYGKLNAEAGSGDDDGDTQLGPDAAGWIPPEWRKP
jgi:hypothetical protein